MHPLDSNRDANSQGRVRVQLWNDDGSLCNQKFPKSMYYLMFRKFGKFNF